jgi:hypothetical protein
MKFYGYRADNDSETPEVLTEVTLVASPTTLRQLAAFLLHTANLIEEHGPRFGHEHFERQGQDEPAFIVAGEE